MSTMQYSRAALLKFLDTLSAQGLANGNTAQSLKVACGKILVDLSEAEESDVRKVDVALSVKKFHNKNPGSLSPSSLAEYQRRVGLAIREFDLYQGNPTGYKGIGRGPTRTDSSEKGPAKKKDSPSRAPLALTDDSKPSLPPSGAGGISHTYPLRPDFLAQVVLPRDLKSTEARRLAAYIQTLAHDFTPKE